MTEELSNLISDFGGGRKKETQKEQYFRQESISILRKFENRTYKELEEFCEYLKESGKSATLQLRGAESYISEDSFYKKLIVD